MSQIELIVFVNGQEPVFCWSCQCTRLV